MTVTVPEASVSNSVTIAKDTAASSSMPTSFSGPMAVRDVSAEVIVTDVVPLVGSYVSSPA